MEGNAVMSDEKMRDALRTVQLAKLNGLFDVAIAHQINGDVDRVFAEVDAALTKQEAGEVSRSQTARDGEEAHADIVAVLRHCASLRQTPTWGQIQDAADIIWRLRHDLDEARALKQEGGCPGDGGWRGIASAPKDRECDFWLEWADDVASINPSLKYHHHRGRYGTWSSVFKATHWQPLPSPPAAKVEDGK
jgi:hypothetical protein